MKRVMVSLLAAVVVFLSTSEAVGQVSTQDREAVDVWVRSLTGLKESNMPLATTQNDLPVVFNLRDLPAFERLSVQKNDYVFSLFLMVDRSTVQHK